MKRPKTAKYNVGNMKSAESLKSELGPPQGVWYGISDWDETK